VTKPELGCKRKCQECDAPFYDLNKKQIECPKCGAAFNPAPPARQRRAAPKPVETPAVVAPNKTKKDALILVDDDDDDDLPDEVILDAEGLDDEDDDDDDDDDNDLIEDTSDLGEDDDDMSEVKEHIDDGIEDKI